MKQLLFTLLGTIILSCPVWADDFGARFNDQTPAALSDGGFGLDGADTFDPNSIEPAAGEEETSAPSILDDNQTSETVGTALNPEEHADHDLTK